MQQKSPHSISAKDLYNWLNNQSEQPVLVDVREDQELEIAPFPGPVVHLPLSQAAIWTKSFSRRFTTDKPVVVVCHAGVRSWDFGMWLVEQAWGFEVWNLEGGIDAWSRNVDASVPLY